jgi:hypothetical protein
MTYDICCRDVLVGMQADRHASPNARHSHICILLRTSTPLYLPVAGNDRVLYVLYVLYTYNHTIFTPPMKTASQ